MPGRRITAIAGGLLHHHFTLTPDGAVYFCGPFQQVFPLRVLPGTLLYGVRTFLDLDRRDRAHPTNPGQRHDTCSWEASQYQTKKEIRFSLGWTNLYPSSKILLRNSDKYWRITLANIKSQIKRNRQNEKRRIRNRVFRGRARTFVQKARVAIDSGDPEQARTATLEAISELDRAAEKGVIHKNNAARRKSRLMKKLASQAK